MTTNELMQSAANILQTVTGRSALSMEAWIYLAFGALGFVLVMRFAGAAFSFQRNTFITALLGSLFAGVLIFAAMYALNAFAAPHTGTIVSPRALLITGAAVVVLAVVLPLFMLVYKTSYLRVGLVVALAVAAAVGCAVLARGGHNAFKTGDRGLDGARAHRKMIEEEAK